MCFCFSRHMQTWADSNEHKKVLTFSSAGVLLLWKTRVNTCFRLREEGPCPSLSLATTIARVSEHADIVKRIATVACFSSRLVEQVLRSIT